MTDAKQGWVSKSGVMIELTRGSQSDIVLQPAGDGGIKTPLWVDGYSGEMVAFERAVIAALNGSEGSEPSVGIDIGTSFPLTPAAFVTFGSVLRHIEANPEAFKRIRLNVPDLAYDEFASAFQEFKETMTG